MKRDRQIDRNRERRDMGRKREGKCKRKKILGKLIFYINEKRRIYWIRKFLKILYVNNSMSVLIQ